MTTVTRPPAPTPTGNESRRRMLVRRSLTLLTIVLLVGIPAGYLLVSAEQSRESGRDKEADAKATGLRDRWPSLVKRRIFEIPIPDGAWRVGYFETSNWKTSRFYVQFRTTPDGLEEFLRDVGTDRSALNDGEVTIDDRHADVVGWNFTLPDREWAGLTHRNTPPRPTQSITVDLSEPLKPWVYVVSTSTP
ncbi:hypothetical protein ACRAR1_03560 [Streptomyces sanyensis]|uniref:hypothetical protein n=1 Tax=Streptomyces sanyensis TaxID=568869 RepID=UPI003D76D216